MAMLKDTGDGAFRENLRSMRNSGMSEADGAKMAIQRDRAQRAAPPGLPGMAAPSPMAGPAGAAMGAPSAAPSGSMGSSAPSAAAGGSPQAGAWEGLTEADRAYALQAMTTEGRTADPYLISKFGGAPSAPAGNMAGTPQPLQAQAPGLQALPGQPKETVPGAPRVPQPKPVKDASESY